MNKAKFAGVLGFVIAIAMTIIGVVVVSVDTTESAKLGVSVFSPAAFVIANQQIMESETAHIGTMTSNLHTKFKHNCPSVADMIGFIYLDIFLYAFLAWCIFLRLFCDFR